MSLTKRRTDQHCRETDKLALSRVLLIMACLYDHVSVFV